MTSQTFKRPRTKPPEQRREELMNAAAKLFVGNGVKATSIDAIAEAAGVAKGTFYLYFATKDDIVVALVDRYAEHYGQALNAAIAARPADDWPGKLAAWVTTAVDRLLDGGELAEAVFHQHPQPASNVLERAGAAPLAELLADGHAAGVWQVSDSRTVATFIFAGLHGVVDDLLFRGVDLNDRATRASLHGLVHKLLSHHIAAQ